MEVARSSSLDIDIGSREDYAEIEAVSRAADRHEVFSPLTARLLHWFLDANPCGPGFVVIARDRTSRTLVGHFVFYRWALRKRTPAGVINLPSALYVRLYVDRTFRRRGIFAAMTRAGLERLGRLGVPLAYTAPNPRSSPGFVKFGMRSVGPLPFRLRPAVPGWGRLMGGDARGFRVERHERFDSIPEPLFEASLPSHVAFWSARTAALMNWRYADRPDSSYEIRYLLDDSGVIGFMVTRRMAIKGLDVVALCDFWVAPGRELALRAGMDDALAGNRGARGAIAIGASATPSLTRALAQAAFVKCPARLLPQPIRLFGGPVGASVPAQRLPKQDAWHVTPYDWDVF